MLQSSTASRYTPGDVVDGAEIVAIEPGTVRLRENGTELVISLGRRASVRRTDCARRDGPMTPIPKRRRTWRSATLALAAGASLSLAAGCASERGVATQDAIAASMQEAVRPTPQAEVPFAVPPKPVIPAAVEERFDVDVIGADARDFFMGLVEGTSRNLIVHPEVERHGHVDAEAGDVAGGARHHARRVRIRLSAHGRHVRRAARNAAVPRVRDRLPEPDSRRRVAHARELGADDANDVGRRQQRLQRQRRATPARAAASRPQTTGSVIDTVNNSDFWADLQTTLTAIIGTGEGRQIVVNAQSGVVFARGMPEELRAIGEYLERIHGAAKRQVVLEAKIIEVTLSDGFQAGVNWAAVQQQTDGDVITGGNLSGGGQLGSTPPLAPPLAGQPLPIAPGNPITGFGSETLGAAFALAFDIGDFNAFVELLETQGDTRVLSSPRVATLNNQKAVIKAGTDEFFVTEVRSNTVTGTASTTSRDVTLTPFFSGDRARRDAADQRRRRGHAAHSPHRQRSDGSNEGADDLGTDGHAAARVQRDPRGRQHREGEERPDHCDRRVDAQLVEARRFRDSRCSAACRASGACSAARATSKR